MLNLPKNHKRPLYKVSMNVNLQVIDNTNKVQVLVWEDQT
jgi:hypothetical protein